MLLGKYLKIWTSGHAGCEATTLPTGPCAIIKIIRTFDLNMILLRSRFW